MKTATLFAAGALFASSAAASSHFGSGTAFVHRRHVAAAGRLTSPMARRSEQAKRRMTAADHQPLQRRKTPLGWGDSTSLPDNVADGSDQDGCTCWHTVADGEVCLGLIDKSSEGFTIEKFHSFNPAVNSDCSNLENGMAYCVDDGANGEAADASATTSAEDAAATNGSVNLSTSGDDDEPTQCESEDDEGDDDDETETDDDEEEDCDEENESTSSDSDAEVQATTQAATQAAATTSAAAPTSSKVWSSSQAASSSKAWSSSQAAPSSSSAAAAATVDAKVNVQAKHKHSSKWEAPQSSNSQQQEQKPSSSAQQAKPSQSSSDSSSSDSSSSSSSGDWTSGSVTYYYQNGVAGACGTVNSDNAMIAAVYNGLYDNGNACGKTITIKNDAGASIDVVVADLCPSCTDNSHVDLSEGAFLKLGTLSQGLISVDWSIS